MLQIFVVDWPSYNRSLVRRGEIHFSYDFLDTWDSELAMMNKNKKGKPYSFPDSFILVIGYMRISFHLPYRQTQKEYSRQQEKVYPIIQVMATYVKESTG